MEVRNKAFRVLVTGADGFVGKALCAEMVSRGWKVRAAVRSRKKIKSLPAEIEIIETGLIGPDTDWSKALNGLDAVAHLAARVHIMNDMASDPLAEFRSADYTKMKYASILEQE